MDNNNQNDNVESIKSGLFNLPPRQFSLASSIIGLLLIDDLDVDQQNTLGNFLVTMGQNILTAAGQEEILNAEDSQENDNAKQIEELKNQLSRLEDQLAEK